MEHLNQTLNSKALNDALVLMFGQQVTAIVGKLYYTIDRAMKDGYELGVLDGVKAVEETADKAFDEGFDQGYDQGEADGLYEADESYIQGVADARARPQLADDNVAQIISLLAKNAINGEYDADLVQDSGDEA
jgi:hypothetical protein